MDAAVPPRAPRPDAVAALVGACSIELSPRDELAGAGLRGLFPAATAVFVNQPASAMPHHVVAACARLRAAGFEPVPHVLARPLTGFTQASDFLARLAGEAGVTHVLLLGGDADRPAGPFRSAFDLLATGVAERHGIQQVSFAGYPEGHPRIDSATLQQALRAKVELARQRGLAVWLVTQFGFEAAPIHAWIAAQRAAGIDCPIRIGVAGPASVATLAKYAVRCGIGTSLRALARGHAAFARILTEATPDALVEALVAGGGEAGGAHGPDGGADGPDGSAVRPGDSAHGLTGDAGGGGAGEPRADRGAAWASGEGAIGLHVFTFGGVRRTADWVRGTLARHAV
jgi:methylenetetrahydrofolate reductase (NADPH)